MLTLTHHPPHHFCMAWLPWPCHVILVGSFSLFSQTFSYVYFLIMVVGRAGWWVGPGWANPLPQHGTPSAFWVGGAAGSWHAPSLALKGEAERLDGQGEDGTPALPVAPDLPGDWDPHRSFSQHGGQASMVVAPSWPPPQAGRQCPVPRQCPTAFSPPPPPPRQLTVPSPTTSPPSSMWALW